MHQARVGVIGAGPSGLYAVAALLGSGEPVSISVLDRLPGFVDSNVEPKNLEQKQIGDLGVPEVPDRDGGPSRIRPLDPLIPSRSRRRTRKHPKEPPPENSGGSA